MLLTFDIDKILTVSRLLLKQGLDIADRWRQVVRAIEEPDGLGQCGHCIDGDSLYDGGLGSVLRWHQYSRYLCLTRCQGHWHGASHSFDAPIERQFPDHDILVQLVRMDIPGSVQDAQGNGKVKGRPFLAQVGWGKIHRDTFQRERESHYWP